MVEMLRLFVTPFRLEDIRDVALKVRGEFEPSRLDTNIRAEPISMFNMTAKRYHCLRIPPEPLN